jgi:hypothetical protein
VQKKETLDIFFDWRHGGTAASGGDASSETIGGVLGEFWGSFGAVWGRLRQPEALLPTY